MKTKDIYFNKNFAMLRGTIILFYATAPSNATNVPLIYDNSQRPQLWPRAINDRP